VLFWGGGLNWGFFFQICLIFISNLIFIFVGLRAPAKELFYLCFVFLGLNFGFCGGWV